MKIKIFIIAITVCFFTTTLSIGQKAPSILLNTQVSKIHITLDELKKADSIIVEDNAMLFKSCNLSIQTGPKDTDLKLLQLDGNKLSVASKEILMTLNFKGKVLFEHIKLVDKKTGATIEASPIQIKII